MALATLFAPEAICVTALGQYFSAYRSVNDFSAAGIDGWTMRHAFIADMGGFLFQTPDWVPFPINAKQLLWLIQNGHVITPQKEMVTILDKNKTDGFMRLITTAQTIWFCANIIGRLIQGLAIMAIEVTTVAFIYCGLIMMFLWRHKPAGIGTAETLYKNTSIRDILLAGGAAAEKPYKKTPLEFVCRK